MEKDVIIGGRWKILGEMYDGNLIFNKSNGIILLSIYYMDTEKLFGWYNKARNISEIIGDTNQQCSCILTDCELIKNHTDNFVRHHIVFKAKNLFWGISRTKKNDMKFNEMRFQLSNIFQWSKLNGFEINDDEKYELSLGYRFKDKIIVTIDKSTSVEFVPVLGKFKCDVLIEDIHLSQFVEIRIIKNNSTFYEEFFSDLNKVINMIMFATDIKIDINKIICIDYGKYNLINDNKVYLEVELISHCMRKVDNNIVLNSKDSFYYLFDLPEIVKDGKIENWFKSYDKYKSIYDLYLLGIKNDVPKEIRFSNLIQALELIHSIKFKRKDKFYKHVENKFSYNQCIIDNIENNIDQKDSSYIILRSRLIDLFISPFDITTKKIIKDNIFEFTDILTDSRNYYTHYNSSKRNKCVVKENLENSIFILQYFVSCYVLFNLGFSIEYINKKYERVVNIINNNNFIGKIIENKR